MSLNQTLVNAGIVPAEMWQTSIYDVMGYKLFIYRESYFFQIRVVHPKEQFSESVCQNLLLVSKELRMIIWQAHFIRITEDGDTMYDDRDRYYGDRYCTAKVHCLKDMSLVDIINICSSFKNDKETSMRFLWK